MAPNQAQFIWADVKVESAYVDEGLARLYDEYYLKNRLCVNLKNGLLDLTLQVFFWCFLVRGFC